MRMVVVLPAPLGPRKPTTSPGATEKLTSRTTSRPPKRRVRAVAEITARCSLPRDACRGRGRLGQPHHDVVAYEVDETGEAPARPHDDDEQQDARADRHDPPVGQVHEQRDA